MPEQQRMAIVFNPLSTPYERVRAAVDAEAGARGWGESRWYATSRDDPGARAARRALADGAAAILIAGGDGTVRAVAEVAMGGGAPLALLPTGTGNLLARNLGLPLGDVARSVRTAFGGRTRLIDSAVAELEDGEGARSSHAFFVMAGIGLDAEMAEHTNALAKKHLGWLAYASPIARSVLANKAFHVRYRVDRGPVRSTRAHTIIVGNCGSLTGGMLLLPAAVPDDGLLDAVMLRPSGRFGWVGIGTHLTMRGMAQRSRLGGLVFGGAPDIRAVAYAQGSRLEIRFDVAHTIELDGDSFGPVLGARVTVRPGSVRVLVDAASAGSERTASARAGEERGEMTQDAPERSSRGSGA